MYTGYLLFYNYSSSSYGSSLYLRYCPSITLMIRSTEDTTLSKVMHIRAMEIDPKEPPKVKPVTGVKS